MNKELLQTFDDIKVEQYLIDLKEAFESSIEYIEEILQGRNIESNLGYIVRDWNASRCTWHERNEVIKKEIDFLETKLKDMKSS